MSVRRRGVFALLLGVTLPSSSAPIVGALPAPTGTARFLDSGDGTGTAVTAPQVRQWLYVDPGPFTNIPTGYDYQIFADGALAGSGTFAAPGDFAFQVTDDLATTQLQVKCHGINGVGPSAITSDSAATTAVAAMSATGGITLATRASGSGVTPPVVQITFDLTKALPGDSVRVRESTDGTFSGADVVQSVVHFLTSTDLAAMPVVLDFVSDGFTTPGATSFLDYALEMTSPHGAFLSYTYPTDISPTDAAPGHVDYRLIATADNGGGGLAATEIELALTVGGSNIATGATLTASSNFGGSFDVARINDGNTGTIGATDLAGVPPTQWLRFHFGSPQDAHQLKYRSWTGHAAATPRDFKIQYSDDGGANWSDLVTQTGVTWTDGEVKTWTW